MRPLKWSRRRKNKKVKPYPIFKTTRLRSLAPPPSPTSLKRTHEALAKKLSKQAVKNVVYTGTKILLTFNGERLCNEVCIVAHNPWVASWDKKQPIVIIHEALPEKWHESSSIHETVEKYAWERYGLDPNAEGHEMAEVVEHKRFLEKRSEKEWEDYSRTVERIHRQELNKLQVAFFR
jgi:hypothetical protein